MTDYFWPTDLYPSTRLVPVEGALTPEQRFRLIEIAYETTSPEIRLAALALLKLQNLVIAEAPGAQ